MNAAVFRHLFDYHFAENRTLWGGVARLSEAQYTQAAGYSHGAVRDQLVHLISVDQTWFCGLRGGPIPAPLIGADFPSRDGLRAHWDGVEQTMRAYLASLRDEMLWAQPLEGEDQPLRVWQVLVQVVNHGTDHRAQLLRQLHDLGIKTASQDYIFFAYENRWPPATAGPDPAANP